jgi:hypothetical protein
MPDFGLRSAEVGGETAVSGEYSYRNFSWFSKRLPMELNALNFVQRFCCQVTFTTMGATDHRDVLNNK